MIATSINSPEIEIYAKAHSRFAEALEIVKRYLSEDLPDGQRAVDLGDELFANVLTYETKAPESSVFEVHKKYIDIQYIVKGEEVIEVAPIQTEKKLVEAKEENDVWFYESATQPVILKEGDFMVLYPSDLHLPGKAVNNPQNVLKVVLKVRDD